MNTPRAAIRKRTCSYDDERVNGRKPFFCCCCRYDNVWITNTNIKSIFYMILSVGCTNTLAHSTTRAPFHFSACLVTYSSFFFFFAPDMFYAFGTKKQFLWKVYSRLKIQAILVPSYLHSLAIFADEKISFFLYFAWNLILLNSTVFFIDIYCEIIFRLCVWQSSIEKS